MRGFNDVAEAILDEHESPTLDRAMNELQAAFRVALSHKFDHSTAVETRVAVYNELSSNIEEAFRFVCQLESRWFQREQLRWAAFQAARDSL